MLRLGLIGAGRMGSVHAKHAAALQGVELTHVVDVNAKAAERLAASLDAKASTMPSDILSDGSVDAVLIASATSTHLELIKAAAREGKAIFCESPIGLDLKDVDEALAEVRQAGAPLFVGLNRRYDHAHRRLAAALAEGAVGRIETMSLVSREPSVPSRAYLETAGDLFHDRSIYDFDVARWLMGEEFVEVHAVGSALVDPALAETGDVDTAMVTLKTASGALCHVNNGRRSSYGFDQRVEVFGENGMVQLGYDAQATHSRWGADGVTLDKPPFLFVDRYRDAYRVELEQFVTAVESGETADIEQSGRDARQALALADAASRSLKEGRPVRLD